MRRTFAVIVYVILLIRLGSAHEGGTGNQKPTKAQKDLNAARKAMRSAKDKLLRAGKYSCCVRPSCDLCARTKGRCDCAENLHAGKGVCGECYAGLVGRGRSAGELKLDPAIAQAGTASPELRKEIEALIQAKRTLASEKRYFCCMRGGCAQCAHEADCPCGSDLASVPAKGVCGECFDAWHSGQGAFAGIPLSDVTVAVMPGTAGSMSPGGGDASGWYASGTSQVPRAAPMNMLHGRFRNWSLMLQGAMFGVYTNQTGPRGRDKLFVSNWFMPMASRRLGPGVVTLRSMLSLEPATITNRRYPLLLQTGETAYGIPVINGQHPHDFFMELAASYHLPMGEQTALNFYGGVRGEPALGPPAFPHRLSASENPIAVAAHHYQDSTHIAANVITAGLTHGPVTIELSGFHGREPDEKRWGIESGAIDSFAARLTLTPTRRWSGQFSIGRINNRELLHPLRDTLRSSASLMYVRPAAAGHWATSLIWGRNNDLAYTQPPSVSAPATSLAKDRRRSIVPEPVIVPKHFVSIPTRIPRQIYNSYLLESTLLFRNKNWIWSRVESVDKDSLLLFEETPIALLVDERRLARVQAYTAGYQRELPRMVGWLSQGIGCQVTVYRLPGELSPVYNGHPAGVQLFLRMRFTSGR